MVELDSGAIFLPGGGVGAPSDETAWSRGSSRRRQAMELAWPTGVTERRRSFSGGGDGAWLVVAPGDTGSGAAPAGGCGARALGVGSRPVAGAAARAGWCTTRAGEQREAAGGELRRLGAVLATVLGTGVAPAGEQDGGALGAERLLVCRRGLVEVAHGRESVGWERELSQLSG